MGQLNRSSDFPQQIVVRTVSLSGALDQKRSVLAWRGSLVRFIGRARARALKADDRL